MGVAGRGNVVDNRVKKFVDSVSPRRVGGWEVGFREVQEEDERRSYHMAAIIIVAVYAGLFIICRCLWPPELRNMEAAVEAACTQ